jgi:hypothetical protein
MRKGLRNAALIGGAALLASKIMGGSKDSKKRKEEQDKDADMDVTSRPDMSTTGDASAGLARDRMSDFRTAAQEAADDAKIRAATNNFGRGTAGRSSASQAADAIAAAKTAGELNRERAAYLSRGVGANQDADAMEAAKTAADFLKIFNREGCIAPAANHRSIRAHPHVGPRGGIRPRTSPHQHRQQHHGKAKRLIKPTCG